MHCASLEAATATIFDNGDGVNTGRHIVYTITVKNTGGVTLTGITLTDTLKNGIGETNIKWRSKLRLQQALV